jgi:hypothetical protein
MKLGLAVSVFRHKNDSGSKKLSFATRLQHSRRTIALDAHLEGGDGRMKRTWKLWTGSAAILSAVLFLANAPAQAVSVPIAWDAVTTNADGTAITDLGGYRLFHSTVSFQRSNVWVSTTQATNDAFVTKTSIPGTGTTYTANLTGPATYFFRLVAYDTANNVSGFNVNSTGGDVQLSRFVSDRVRCDVNGDGRTSAADIQLTINMVLQLTACTGDVNQDGRCSAADVNLITISVLNGGTCVAQ